jgi:predicted transposase/invertase (TIGR01784 family)
MCTYLFRLAKGQLVEQSPDHEGYLTLPEIDLKINTLGQEIRLVDKLTGEVLLDVTELKEALESEVEKAKEARRQAELKAQAEAQRAEAEAQRANAEAKRADAAEQRAQTAFSNGEQKKALETARQMLADGLDSAIVIKYTGLSIDELATIKYNE